MNEAIPPLPNMAVRQVQGHYLFTSTPSNKKEWKDVLQVHTLSMLIICTLL